MRLQGILYQALGEAIGLVLQTDDPKRARQRLYQARQQAGDSALAHLQFRLSPKAENEIFITKGKS